MSPCYCFCRHFRLLCFHFSSSLRSRDARRSLHCASSSDSNSSCTCPSGNYIRSFIQSPSLHCIVYCIVSSLYIYITLFALHTNQKCFKCMRQTQREETPSTS